MRKVFVPKLNLVVTVHAACGMGDDAVGEAVVAGIHTLHQYNGDPCGAMGAVEKANPRSDDADNRDIMCLPGLCTIVQVFASVLLKTDVHKIQALLSSAGKDDYEPWEIRHAEAVVAFAAGYDVAKAIQLAEVALAITPHDVFTQRLLFFLCFIAADYATMRSAFCGAVAAYRSDLTSSSATELFFPYTLTMAAFAMEECGFYAQSLAWCEEAMALVASLNARGVRVDDAPLHCPYTVHVVIHYYESNGDPRGGLDAVARIDAALWKPTKHLTGHIWWHIALFHFDLGDVAAALDVYDTHIQPSSSDVDVFSLSDNTALLWRMFLGGKIARAAPETDPMHRRVVALYAQWDTHTPQQTERLGGPGVPRTMLLPFFDVHFRCAQVMAIHTLPETISGGVVQALQDDLATMDTLALPDGHAAAPYAMAVAFLRAAIAYCLGPAASSTAPYDTMLAAQRAGHFRRMGGSGAQRDLLHRTLDFYALHSGSEDAIAVCIAKLRGLACAFPRNPYFACLAEQFTSRRLT